MHYRIPTPRAVLLCRLRRGSRDLLEAVGIAALLSSPGWLGALLDIL